LRNIAAVDRNANATRDATPFSH